MSKKQETAAKQAATPSSPPKKSKICQKKSKIGQIFLNEK
jgi:hypothetical protein